MIIGVVRKNFFGFVSPLVFAAFAVVFISFTPHAFAQTASNPLFIVTWKTSGSYVPSFYTGKSLPTYGSQVTASVELVVNGSLVNLKNQTIYWYMDDNQVGGGVGAQTATFPLTDEPPTTHAIKVTLPYYSSGFQQYTTQVPMVQPVAVIYAPYPNNQFSTNPLNVRAIPYFFNTTAASTLAFTWTVNGQGGSNAENPDQAQITLPNGTSAGAALSVSLSIQNHNDSTIGAAEKDLIYQNQL